MTNINTLLPKRLLNPLRLFVILFCIFILWASLRSSAGGIDIPHFDKAMHLGVYGVLAFCVNFAWPRFHKIITWFSCILYGGLLELAQGTLTIGRTASFWDFVANATGAAMALIFIMMIEKTMFKSKDKPRENAEL